jgi:hypothetical protein
MSGGSQIPDTQENSDRSGQNQQSSAESGREGFGESTADNIAQTKQLTPVIEIPSTQHTSSQSQPASSQQGFSIPPLPLHAQAANAAAQQAAALHGSATVPNTTHATMVHTSNIASILNAPEPDPPLLLDETTLAELHKELVTRSSGMSVEQLEQIMSVLMSTIWAGRGKWNRNSLVESLEVAFNNIVKDIEHMQEVLDASAGRGEVEREWIMHQERNVRPDLIDEENGWD